MTYERRGERLHFYEFNTRVRFMALIYRLCVCTALTARLVAASI